MLSLLFEIIRSKFFPMALEFIVLFLCGFSLWYKILLPEAYFLTAITLIVIFAVQITKKKYRTLLIFQIAVLGLFLRNVYSLNANFGIIPFDDGNWDYAVVKKFIEEGRVYVIKGAEPPIRLMEWYSQWPFLHILSVVLSGVSGIDALYSVYLIPSLISLLSFAFVFLLVENLRKTLKINKIITPISLLMYVTAAESIFWPMQFVHQNIGILFATTIIYLIFRFPTFYDRKGAILIYLFIFSLIMSHSLTSFVTVAYIVFLFFISIIWFSFKQKKPETKLLKKNFLRTLANISLVSLVFLFMWCENYALGIWSYVSSGLNRFTELLLGVGKFEYLPSSVNYPNVLTQPWALIMLILRDILIYVPAILGLFFVLFKIKSTPQKSILIFTVLAFGSVFIINNFVFRVEVFRVLTISLPIIVFLGAISYSQFLRKSKLVTEIVAISCIMFLVLSSFVGLWGHQFAPIHLYYPSVDSIELGERYTDPLRVKNFFSEKVPIDSYDVVWADDRNPLVYLIHSKNFYKVNQLSLGSNFTIGSKDKTLVCSFKDLFMYSYFARRYTLFDTVQDAKVARYSLNQQLNRLNIVFDDGKYRFWVGG